MLRKLALAQGAFYLVTGLWPVLDINSFQLVTGPKTDLWLVKTVGLLITVIGGVLLSAWRARRITSEMVMLGAGSAFALAGIDLYYSLSGRISAVYLGDAVVELALVGAWMIGRSRS